jgi:hypothetical protein
VSIYSVSCGLSAVPAPTGPDRHKTGADRTGLFYDVFDTHFVLNSPNRHDILKILINYVIKQPVPVGTGHVPVGTGLVPVQSDQGRSVPVPVDADLGRSGPVVAGASAGTGSPQCRPVPVPLTDRKKRCKHMGLLPSICTVLRIRKCCINLFT